MSRNVTPLTITQVDAFTDEAFAGNPAAVCLLPEAREEAWSSGWRGRWPGSRCLSKHGRVALAHLGRSAEAREVLRKHMAELNIGPEDNETPTPVLLPLLEAAVLLARQRRRRTSPNRSTPFAP